MNIPGTLGAAPSMSAARIDFSHHMIWREDAASSFRMTPSQFGVND
jgi:hypothetical protein